MFQYAEALKAGYSDQEIAEYLSKDSQFDINGAVDAGYSHGEISRHLAGIKEDDWQKQISREPVEDPGIIKTAGKGLAHGVLGLAESVGTGAEYLGKRVGSETLSNAGKTAKEYWGEKAEGFRPSDEINGKNVWDNPELLGNAEWWVYNVSDMVPMLAASVVPGAAAAKGIQAVSGISKLARIGGSLVGGTFGGAIEGTQTYNAVLEKGGTEEEAARASELMTVGAGVLNAFGVGKVLNKAGAGFKGKIIKHLGAAAWEGVSEGLEEPTEVFSKYFGAYLAGEELPTDLEAQLIQSAKDALTVAPIAALTGGGASVMAGSDAMSNDPELSEVSDNDNKEIIDDLTFGRTTDLDTDGIDLVTPENRDEFNEGLAFADDLKRTSPRQAQNQNEIDLNDRKESFSGTMADIQAKRGDVDRAIEDEGWLKTEEEIKTQREIQTAIEKVKTLESELSELQSQKQTGKNKIRINKIKKDIAALREIIPKTDRVSKQAGINQERIKEQQFILGDLEAGRFVNPAKLRKYPGLVPEEEIIDRPITKKEAVDLQTLEVMQSQVNNSHTRGVNQERVGQPGETVAYPATSPQWMRELPLDQNGNVYSRKQLNAVFDNVRNGKKLTENQDILYGHIQNAMGRVQSTDPELASSYEAENLESKGYEVLGGQKLSAAELEQGDKFVGTVDGVKDEWEVKGEENGEVVLQDGVTKRIDLFDQVSVDGIKPGESNEKIKTSDKTDIPTVGSDIEPDIKIPPEKPKKADLKPETEKATPTIQKEADSDKVAPVAGGDTPEPEIVEGDNLNKKPLTLHHGTSKNFTEFDPDKGELGNHFGPHSIAKEVADRSKGGKVVTAEITLNNPYDIVSDLGDWNDMEMLEEYLGEANEGPFTDKEFAEFKTPKDVRDGLIAKGYDGIKYQNSFEGKPDSKMGSESQDSYIVFNPEQIKTDEPKIVRKKSSDPGPEYTIPDQQKKQTLSSGQAVTWKTKKGKEFSGTLVKKNKKYWTVKKEDGKNTLVFERELQVADVPAVTDPIKRKQTLKNSISEGKSILNGNVSGDKRKAIDRQVKKEEAELDKLSLIEILPNDLNYQRAYDAHRGTSHVPEDRAKQEQRGYVQHMESVRDYFLKKIKPEQRATLSSELERYKTGYLQKYGALLDARSKTMSSMITGASKFPTRSNQKKLDTEHRRFEEFQEWDKKARKSIKRELGLLNTGISSDDPQAIQKLKEKLGNLEKSHQMMKDANRIVRAKKKSDKEKAQALIDLGLSKKMAVEAMTPDYMGKLGFASYALTNNNANIKRTKNRIAELEKKSQDETQSFQVGDVEIIDNVEDNRVQIVFDGKPSEKIRNKLKSNGFKWSPKNKVWQRKRNTHVVSIAKDIFEKQSLENKEKTDIIEEKKSKYAQKDLFNENPEKSKQLDLFPVSDTSGNQNTGKGKRKKTSGKTNQKIKGLSSKVSIGVETTGNILHNGLAVTSSADAAALLTHLTKSPQEKLYTVAVDKKGMVIEVHSYSKGAATSSIANAVEIAGRVLKNKNADKVYFVHNHPSGDIVPSASDINMSRRIENILKLRKIKIDSLIVANDGGEEIWSDFNSLSSPGGYFPRYSIQKTIKKTKIPIKERVFIEKQAPGMVINTLDIAENVLSKKPSGFLFLDAKAREVGFLEYPAGMKARDISSLIFEAAEDTNAVAVILHDKEGNNDARGRFFLNIAQGLSDSGVTVHDILVRDGDKYSHSVSPAGSQGGFVGMDSDEVMFQTSEDPTPGQGITLQDIQSRFKGQEVFISPDNSISVRYKNGRGVRIISTNQMGEGAYQYAVESGAMSDKGVILGTTEDSTITLNKDLANKFTMDHELYHTLRNAGMITPADRLRLRGKFHNLKKAGKLKFKEARIKHEAVAKEENEANTFAQILEDRESYRSTPLGKIIQKVMDFIDGLWHIGRMSARKLAREVETGKIFERGVTGEEVSAGIKHRTKEPTDTNTKNFKNWFKKSITIHPKTKKPVVFYHGTGENFTEFKDMPGGSTTHTSAGLGHFFSMVRSKAKHYAGDHGNVMPVYLKMEKAYPMSLKEAQSFETVQDSIARKKELQAKGYDSIIIKVPGDATVFTVFEPTNVKSIHNMGTWSPENPNIMFQTSEDFKAYDKIESNLFQKATDFFKGNIKYRKDKGKNYNEDLSLSAHLLKTTMYNAEKMGGAYKRLWEAIRKKDDHKFRTQRELWYEGDISLLDSLKTFSKKLKAEYQKLKSYLLEKDINAKGFVVKGSDGSDEYILQHWKKENGVRKTIGTYENEEDAWKDAILIEADESGLSDKGKEALIHFRKMSHNLYHHFAKNLEETISAYEKAGQPIPQITMQTADGDIKIDLYAAADRMGDLRGHYFPRLRNSGQWRVVGNKKGIASQMQFFDTRMGANSYRAGLERKGYETEIEKVGSLSEDLFAALEPLLAQQQILNKALKDISNEDKQRVLEDANIKGEWRGDTFVLMGNLDPQLEVAVQHLGGKFKERFLKNSYRPEIVFEDIKEQNPDVFEQEVTNAILHSGGMDIDIDLAFAHAMVKQYDAVLKGRGARSRMISRDDARGIDVIQGYETDPLTAITQAMQAAAGSEAKSIIAREGSAAITGRDISWQDYKAEHESGAIKQLEKELDELRLNSPDDEKRKGILKDKLLKIRYELSNSYAPSPDYIIKKQREIKKIQDEMKSLTKWKDIGAAQKIKKQITMARQGLYEDYLKLVNERKIDAKTQGKTYKEATGALEDILRNEEFADRVLGTLKGLAVWQYLGLRVSSAAVNLTNMVTGVPAAINGETDNEVSIHKSLKHIAAGMKDFRLHRSGKLAGQKKKVFDEIRERGWDNPVFNREAFDVLSTKLGKGWNFALEKSMWMFGKTEELNRAATIAGTYFAMKDKHKGKWDHEAMMQKAKDISDKAHGVYGKENRPFQMRGGNLASRILQSGYVFQTFTHNYLQEMWRLGFDKKQYKAAAYMALSPAMFGVGATVPMGIAKAVSKSLGGDDPEEKLIQLAEDSFGGGDIARNGIMGVFDHGINLRGSLATRFGAPSTFADLFGAPGSVVSDWWEGGKNITKGYYREGFEKIMPAAIGNISKGLRESKQGVTTRSGTPVFWGNEQLKGDSIDMVLRMLSFNPTNISKKKEIQWNEYNIQKKYQEHKSDIYKRLKRFYSRPPGERSRADLMEIKADIRDFNTELKNKRLSRVVPLITTKSIKSVLRRLSKAPKRERLRFKQGA